MAATAVYFKNPPLYRSDLKLLIRYVLENRAMSDPSAERQAQIRPVDNRVEGIIASETEILQSWDLLQDVAENITPEKILPAKTTEKTKAAAASYLRKNLRVDILKGSSVITVSLSHHDASLVVQILDKLRELYFQKHLKIHRSSGIFDDFLTKQTDTLRSKLTQTEEELRRIRTNSGDRKSVV